MRIVRIVAGCKTILLSFCLIGVGTIAAPLAQTDIRSFAVTQPGIADATVTGTPAFSGDAPMTVALPPTATPTDTPESTPTPTSCGGSACSVVAWVSTNIPIPSYQYMFGIVCPTVAACYAVGDQGTILATTDAGVTWTRQNSSYGGSLSSISCPTPTTCFAAGNQDGIVATTDGGTTWAHQYTAMAGDSFNSISCPSATTCYASGAFTNPISPSVNAVLVTVDGGATWAARGTAPPFGRTVCPGTSTCYNMRVEHGLDTIAVTHDGGYTWTTPTTFPSQSQSLINIACPSVSACFAVGYNGAIVATSDGGATWTATSSSTTSNLNGIACPSATICYAVGSGGVIVATMDGGHTWSGRDSGLGAAFYNDLQSIACATPTSCAAIGDGGFVLRGVDAVPPTATPTDTATPTNTPVAFTTGDVLVDGGKGLINDYDPAGHLRQRLDTSMGTLGSLKFRANRRIAVGSRHDRESRHYGGAGG